MFIIIPPSDQGSQKVVLTAVAERVGSILGNHVSPFELSDGKEIAKSAGISAVNPSYGEVKLLGKSFGVIFDRPVDHDWSAYMDIHGNGQYLSVPLTKNWQSYGDANPKRLYYKGPARLDLQLAGQTIPSQIYLCIFDRNGVSKPAQSDKATFWSDFGERGSATFGAEKFDFWVDPSSQDLFFDREHNQTFNKPYDRYKSNQPFSLGGQSWKVANLSLETGSLEIAPCDNSVAEVPMPVRLAAGSASIPFECKSLDGSAISFPDRYEHKLVILDFWATWCGPCLAEAPNLAAVYRKLHPKGLEILGVSVDDADSAPLVPRVAKTKGMTWTLIASPSKTAQIANLYGVHTVPHAFLIDGTTGNILAEGESLRGVNLEKTVSGFLKN